MSPCKVLLSFVLVCLAAVDASPLSRSTGKATLGFTTRFNNLSMLNVVERDRVRAQTLRNAGHLGKIHKRDGTLAATNNFVGYVAEVGVGHPPTNYSLLIDTGSSNTWIGANSSNPYVQTITSQDTHKTVSVSYGSGNFSGEEYTDRVILSPELIILNQSIGVASEATGFDGFDGILGVGPVDLTVQTVTDTEKVPTVTDNLYSQGSISQNVVGFYFVPASETNSTGELHFGGVDQSVITNPVRYVPMTTTSPASNYFGINQSISYGDDTILLSTAGIVDAGTTLILIATDAFKRYQGATGGVVDSSTRLLKITPNQFANLQSLYFQIGGTSYELSPKAQIWPRSLNAVLNGTADSIYLVVNDIGSNSGSGLDFVNGYCFVERYYTVFDTGKQRVGFAPTKYTFSDCN